MPKLVFKATEPEIIEINNVSNGMAECRIRWDIEQVTITEDTGSSMRWEYQEQIMMIPLTDPLYIDGTTISDAGRTYLNANINEILKYAQTDAKTMPPPGQEARNIDLENAIAELSILIAGGGV